VKMKSLSWSMFALSGLLMLGCGGAAKPSIDSSRQLTSLSSSEVEDVCAWQVDRMGGDGSKKKCGDTEFTFKVSTCVKSFSALSSSCAATYADLAACSDAQSHDFCGGAWVANSSCVKINGCGMSTGGE
jgi:hypothetical protein